MNDCTQCKQAVFIIWRIRRLTERRERGEYYTTVYILYTHLLSTEVMRANLHKYMNLDLYFNLLTYLHTYLTCITYWFTYLRTCILAYVSYLWPYLLIYMPYLFTFLIDLLTYVFIYLLMYFYLQPGKYCSKETDENVRELNGTRRRRDPCSIRQPRVNISQNISWTFLNQFIAWFGPWHPPPSVIYLRREPERDREETHVHVDTTGSRWLHHFNANPRSKITGLVIIHYYRYK